MALPQRRTPHTNPIESVGAPDTGADWHALFQIQSSAEVDRFIADHPKIVSVLRRASVEIVSRFGPNVELLLEHTVDPDDEPPCEYLSIDILTGLDHDDAYARRVRFDDEWWFDAIREVAGLLTVDLALR